MTTSARHETRALLRAHLAAAAGYRHFTRHCPICHRLLRLAMEPSAADEAGDRAGDGVGDEADDGVGHQATAAAPPPTRQTLTAVAL
ncbi:DUF6274 family protein [Streptomyces antimycoticus]|uniref:DUF6274 family protein n=1 Tax=Streptomyces antimycoticus TaxID=68175 RepID=UPI00256FCFD3|nr:DUF6274 family protein [Streptomyces antimycoticus]WJD98192.1 DUF6274 family protein [Streptomyces antimycoticus]